MARILVALALIGALAPVAARASGTCSLDGGIMTISATAENDTLGVSVSDGNIQMLLDGVFTTCGALRDTTSLLVNGLAGDDALYLSDPAAFVRSVPTDARTVANPLVDIHLMGNDGTNRFHIYGPSMNIVGGTDGFDVNADDLIDVTVMDVARGSFAGTTGTHRVDLRGNTATGAPFALPTSLAGGNEADTLFGGSANDIFETLLGDDSVNGGGGTDTIVERIEGFYRTETAVAIGVGTDAFTGIELFEITGSAGNDTIRNNAFAGRVTFDGALGNDILVGGNAMDILEGGAGNDLLTGKLGNDMLHGGTGTDGIVETRNANLTVTNSSLTGLGADMLSSIETARLTGGSSANTIRANTFTGRALLFGLGGNDVLVGGTKNDTLRGGANNDRLFGLGGNDSLGGETGTDSCDGGAGTGDTRSSCESFTNFP